MAIRLRGSGVMGLSGELGLWVLCRASESIGGSF